MKEIVVLQAGGNANRLFTSFWNMQFAYLSAGERAPLAECLWMSGQVPRLLSLDNKDQLNLPSLSPPDELLWSEAVSIYTQQPIHSWSTDLSFPLTSKSVLAAEEEVTRKEELEERMRTLVERCDCCQGAISVCDVDWSWAGVGLMELFDDCCPKSPVCLETVKPIRGVMRTELVGKYMVEISEFSHLVHIPAIWDDYTEGLQRHAPSLLVENMSLPWRLQSDLDMRAALQPLMMNAGCNLATAVINSPERQMTVGIPPTECSSAQKWSRGRGHEVGFTVPSFQSSVSFPIDQEYDTICARTKAFEGWLLDLAAAVSRQWRGDEGKEMTNKLLTAAELYT